MTANMRPTSINFKCIDIHASQSYIQHHEDLPNKPDRDAKEALTSFGSRCQFSGKAVLIGGPSSCKKKWSSVI